MSVERSRVARCERDKQDDGSFREGGCEAEATETVDHPNGDEHAFCAAHATEARRLNGLLHKLVAGDPEVRRLTKWINEAGSRAEYDRRVATLPEAW